MEQLKEYFKGSRPEWCISSMIYSRDTPFWPETLDLLTIKKKLHCKALKPASASCKRAVHAPLHMYKSVIPALLFFNLVTYLFSPTLGFLWVYGLQTLNWSYHLYQILGVGAPEHASSPSSSSSSCEEDTATEPCSSCARSPKTLRIRSSLSGWCALK